VLKRIYAVARKTWSEAFHNRAVLLIMLLFVFLLPALPFLVKGDGTQKGLVQLILTYTFLLAHLLISVLTCVLATSTVCGEIERKEVHITDTKPLRRWEFLFGKWLGVLTLDALLLLLIGSVSYGVTLHAARRGGPGDAGQEEAFQEVLVSRRPTPARAILAEDKIREAAVQELEAMRERGDIDPRVREEALLASLEAKYEKWARNIPPGARARWMASGLRPARDESESIHVRYTYQSSEGEPFGEQDTIHGLWRIGSPETALYQMRVDATPGTPHEFEVPAKAIGEDGTLELQFVHESPILAIFQEENVQVLQGRGPFYLNEAKALLLLLFQAAFLAAFAVAVSTYLTFPVAALSMFVVLVACLAGEGVADLIETSALVQPLPLPGRSRYVVDRGLRVFLNAVLTVLPKFGSYTPIDLLITGREIPLSLVAQAAAFLVIVRGGAVAAVGCLIYRFRELARVIA